MYFEHALKYFNLWDLYSLDTSLPPKAQISKHKELLTEEEAQFMVNKPFCLLLGTLLWGSSSTWPDISYTYSVLGQVQVNLPQNIGSYYWKYTTTSAGHSTMVSYIV